MSFSWVFTPSTVILALIAVTLLWQTFKPKA